MADHVVTLPLKNLTNSDIFADTDVVQRPTINEPHPFGRAPLVVGQCFLVGLNLRQLWRTVNSLNL